MTYPSHAFDWSTLYLTCFVIGLVLSVFSFLSGAMHLYIGRVHLGHGHGIGHKGVSHGAAHQGHVSPVNAFTITGFLCWFGGAGYLFGRHSALGWLAVLAVAVLCGMLGAGLLLWFLTGVLMKHERTLEPADTDMIGVLGRISQPVRPGGVGEMLYTQNGTRRSAPVRAVDGGAIARETEVVVMSYERGIARVRRWSEFENGLLEEGGTTSLREP